MTCLFTSRENTGLKGTGEHLLIMLKAQSYKGNLKQHE